MSSGSRSYFQKVPVSDLTIFLTKYDLKGPKMGFQNIIFKEYVRYIKMVKIMKLPLFMVFVNVYSHFRTWTRIRNSRVTDPEKVPDPCGSRSGSITLRQWHEDFSTYKLEL
jgi:hypothetical protein